MSQENAETVRRGIDAWNRGDRAEALAYYAPEAEWHTSGGELLGLAYGHRFQLHGIERSALIGHVRPPSVGVSAR